MNCVKMSSDSTNLLICFKACHLGLYVNIFSTFIKTRKMHFQTHILYPYIYDIIKKKKVQTFFTEDNIVYLLVRNAYIRIKRGRKKVDPLPFII
jgi:hypothetical protein